MTEKMTATTAEATLLAALDRVAGGDEVEITEHGRVVARLIPSRPVRPWHPVVVPWWAGTKYRRPCEVTFTDPAGGSTTTRVDIPNNSPPLARGTPCAGLLPDRPLHLGLVGGERGRRPRHAPRPRVVGGTLGTWSLIERRRR